MRIRFIFLFVILGFTSYSQVHVQVDVSDLKCGKIDSLWVNGISIPNKERQITVYDLENEFYSLKIQTTRKCFEVKFSNEKFSEYCKDYDLSFSRLRRKTWDYHLGCCSHGYNGVLKNCEPK